MLDLDALGAAEGENWVWGGADALGPAYRRCLLFLSRGGADAQVVREFDLVDQRFVDGGFFVPEAKSSLHWIDDDTLYIGSDFGPGSPGNRDLWHRQRLGCGATGAQLKSQPRI